MPRSILALFVVSAVFGWTVACLPRSPLDAEGYACEVDLDCGDSFRCVAGFCGGPPDGTLTTGMIMPLLRLSGTVHNAQRLTLRGGKELETLQDGGYVSDGVVLRVATLLSGDTRSILELREPTTDNWLYTYSTSERDNLLNAGWEDHGTAFFASPTPFDGGTSVFRMQRLGYHRYAVGLEERDTLQAEGWATEFGLLAGSPP